MRKLKKCSGKECIKILCNEFGFVYKKLFDLEKRVARVEKSVIPEAGISKKEAAELEKIRAEIRGGNFVSEKELFCALPKRGASVIIK